MWRINAIIIKMYLIFKKKIYIFNLLANVLKWLKNIMSCLHYIINILSHGINPGENIDSMADEVKKNNGQYLQPFCLNQIVCACSNAALRFIRMLVLRTYSYLRILLNGRFVFPYFSYSLCIFIFHVFVRHR